MNIFEAMWKGKEKAVLCGDKVLSVWGTPRYCFFQNGRFFWTSPFKKEINPVDLVRNDWKPYIEEKQVEIKECCCQDKLNYYGAYVVIDKYGRCIACGKTPRFNQKIEFKVPYETIQETNSSQSKYDHIKKLLEDNIKESVRICDYVNTQHAINTLKLFLELGQQWRV